MRGEFIAVWDDLSNEVWLPLMEQHDVAADVYCEFYREISALLNEEVSIERLADIIDDPEQAENEFLGLTPSRLRGERAAAVFLENAYSILEDFGGDALSNAYFILIERFIAKYSLRYDLRRPCLLCPTMPGVFASLVRDLKHAVRSDSHLQSLMNDFDEAIRDLRSDCSDPRIRTCMVRQINLLEALGARFPGVTENTVGQICNQVNTWPHKKVKEAMKNLYSFTCDYPGIRHAGTPANAVRPIEMRDMVAMSILLVGFLPYLTDQIDADTIYHGK